MEQFKSLTDLRDAIKEIEGYIARPITRLSHPTLYGKRDVDDKEILLKGVRKKDWARLEWHLLKNDILLITKT